MDWLKSHSWINGVIFPAPNNTPLSASISEYHYDSKHQVEYLYFPASGKTTLLYFHGNGEDLASIYPELRSSAREFSQLGISVLAVEYPGYGKERTTGGDCCEFRMTKQYHKRINTVLDALELSTSSLLLVGYSIGSGPACYIAAHDRRVAHLVLLAPFTSIKDVAAHHYTNAVRALMMNRLDNRKQIVKCKCKLSIIHGTKDQVIPHKQSLTLANLHPNPDLVTVYLAEGKSHALSLDLVHQYVIKPAPPDG